MARVLLIAAFVVVSLGGWGLALRSLRGPGRGSVSDPQRALDPGTHRNHLAMARWIDARVRDDLVRPLLGEDEQQRARELLAEFYGDDT